MANNRIMYRTSSGTGGLSPNGMWIDTGDKSEWYEESPFERIMKDILIKDELKKLVKEAVKEILEEMNEEKVKEQFNNEFEITIKRKHGTKM